ncbi:MAG: papain-like cysteine protease family protein [Luteolibacter sp.]|uniref:C39 family peptidase n=1 Tax=Luteolibacter sp. TaxID=1962973 RepID=UPI003265C0D4
MKTKIISLLLGCLISGTAFAQFVPDMQPQQPLSVGLSSNMMNFAAASQEGSQWCWAASIQMVFQRYGVNISQTRIVTRSYGTDQFGHPPNWPGSWQVITANLNNWNLDEVTGMPYQVACQFGQGAPPPTILINELANGCPVILAYRSSPTSGHAVVITGARYYPTPTGPNVVSVIVRDPWPSPENIANRGRKEYEAAQFAQLMQGYWLVRVQRP